MLVLVCFLVDNLDNTGCIPSIREFETVTLHLEKNKFMRKNRTLEFLGGRMEISRLFHPLYNYPFFSCFSPYESQRHE